MRERKTTKANLKQGLLLPFPMKFARTLFCIGMAILMSAVGRAWAAPDWVNGRSSLFPQGTYLVGAGQGDSRDKAQAMAWAELAKMFHAQVNQQTRHWEKYAASKGKAQVEQTIESDTQVVTGRVLEGAEIVETAQEGEVYYALAVIDRLQAATRLTGQIHDLDTQIRQRLAAAETADKVTRIQNYKKAMAAFALREAYNADLTIVSIKGEGVPSRISPVETSRALEVELAKFIIPVNITGDHGDVVQKAVIEALRQEGLSGLSAADIPSADTEANWAPSGPPAGDLWIKGDMALLPVALSGQPFHYIRWCVSLTLNTPAENRIVGAVALSGREGHLSLEEAKARAIRSLQPKVIAGVRTHLSEYLAGQSETHTMPPSDCAR